MIEEMNDIVLNGSISQGYCKNWLHNERFKPLEHTMSYGASPCNNNSFVWRNRQTRANIFIRWVCVCVSISVVLLHGVFRLICSLNVYFRKRLRFIYAAFYLVSTYDAFTQTDTKKNNYNKTAQFVWNLDTWTNDKPNFVVLTKLQYKRKKYRTGFVCL